MDGSGDPSKGIVVKHDGDGRVQVVTDESKGQVVVGGRFHRVGVDQRRRVATVDVVGSGIERDG